MAKVFISRELPQAALDKLYEVLGDDEVSIYPKDQVISRAELLEGVQGVTALLPILTDTVDAAVMDAAGPQLKLIANYAVGFNNIDLREATRRGIIVTNTPGVLTETTADLTWAIMLAAARRLGEGERYLRAGRWTNWAPQLLLGVDVHGKTLGIFGMGRIGQAVALRAKGFGMRIIYTSRSAVDPATKKELNAREVDKATLLAESDFLSLHCPLLPETRHAFGAAEFLAMKRTAVFVNTTRGPVVDEAALAQALKEGEIFAAGLDVFEDEPAVHAALLECENALLIPHLGSATLETRTKMAEIAISNIVAYFAGERPPTCVNPEVLVQE
jgi:glyoxylate reductase